MFFGGSVSHPFCIVRCMLQAVRANKQDLQGLVRDLDPDAIPVCEAPELWKEFVAIARLAESAATLLARRVEEGDTWRQGGFRSAADQMAAEAGTSISAAEDATRDVQAGQAAAADRVGNAQRQVVTGEGEHDQLCREC